MTPVKVSQRIQQANSFYLAKTNPKTCHHLSLSVFLKYYGYFQMFLYRNTYINTRAILFPPTSTSVVFCYWYFSNFIEMQITLYFRAKEKTEKCSLCCYFQSVIPLFSDSTRKSLKHLHTGGLLWSFSRIFLSGGISARSSCKSIKATQLVLGRALYFPIKAALHH